MKRQNQLTLRLKKFSLALESRQSQRDCMPNPHKMVESLDRRAKQLPHSVD